MLLAILIPGLSLMGNGRFLVGLLFLVLQITGIGWVIGAFLALNTRNQVAADKRHREMMAAIAAGKTPA